MNTAELKMNTIEIKNADGIDYLSTILNDSVDLILTDPPYIISKETGMNAHYNKVKLNEENNTQFVKTEEEWNIYKEEYYNNPNNAVEDENNKSIKRIIKLKDSHKEKYMKYGTIYGKKYCVQTNYGVWDSEFTMEKLELFIIEYYKKLKKGGTIIIFFDLWKISHLKEIMEKHKFKQNDGSIVSCIINIVWIFEICSSSV
jgi:site-specific DNA-methyltransferase (adenine-specific)